MMKTTSATLFCGCLLAGLTSASSLAAKEITTRNPTELTAALKTAGAGDIVILAKGTWTDLHLAIARGGKAESPLVIRAEVPGETILNGSSTLAINAPYVTVDGLFFYKGASSSHSVIEFKSHHGVVRNTAIVDYNPAAFNTNYYWVFFSGDYNVVERCYFKGKNNLEPLIGNAIEDSRHNSVVRSYFKNIPYADANGREDLRVWGSGKFDASDKDGAFFTIAENLFERADGEGSEIISLKSNYNRVLNNTVVGTRGCLNIRQGSHNLVQGNVILGRGIAGAQGLRMSGLSNTVQGNYVSGAEFGIRVSTGEYVASALTADYKPKLKPGAKNKNNAEGRIATYPQIKDLTLSDNVTVGISGADLEMGFGYKRHWPEAQMVLLPENCLIKNNRFIRPGGGDSIIGTTPEIAPPLSKFQFVPNRYEGNRLIGGRSAFTLADAGCVVESLPNGWSEATELAAYKVVTAADVGPAWVQTFRSAGKFAMEDDTSCERASAPEVSKKVKNKTPKK
jgi:poly(beta-D-mannuronate) lyase